MINFNGGSMFFSDIEFIDILSSLLFLALNELKFFIK